MPHTGKQKNLHFKRAQGRRHTAGVGAGPVDIDTLVGVVAAGIHDDGRLGGQEDGGDQPQRDGDVFGDEARGHGPQAEDDGGVDGLLRDGLVSRKSRVLPCSIERAS